LQRFAIALSFLLLIGVFLIAGGLEIHIPEGYFYFSMAFAFLVNIFQMKMGKRKLKPVKTHEHYLRDETATQRML
jgi:predicted tellurium resistance membrane protein TerC